MSGIGVIGTEQFTLGFRLAGVRKIWSVDDGPLDGAVQEAVNDQDVSVLVMSTGDMGRIDDRLRRKLQASVNPTLVTVGTEEDNTLRNKIKQAIGVDLW